MTDFTKIKVFDVPLADIEIGDRVHFYDEARIMSLADDIEARGLETPIQLRKLKNGTIRLVAGRHRLEAAKLLGWTTISATVKELTDDEALYAEIEENQQRGTLTVLEHAISLEVLKRLYLKNNPETAHGGDRKSDQIRNSADLIAGGRSPRFTVAMSEELGVSDDLIERRVGIAEKLNDPVLRAEIGRSPLANNQHQLLALTKQAPSERLAIVQAMKKHGKTKVLDGRRKMLGEDDPTADARPPREIWAGKMMALWDAANAKRWQDDFLKKIGARRILEDEDENA